MKDFSQQYQDAMGYGFALALDTSLNGRATHLTYDNLLSFKFSGNGSSDEVLSFGYTSACEISFSIDNIDGRWDDTSFDGAKWNLKLGKNISWEESELVDIGIFTTTEAVVADGAINIKASDNMRKFEEKFRGINYPCTLLELVSQCCQQCGVAFRSTPFPNHDLLLEGAYQLTQITCRKIISLAAEIGGSFAIINSFGELELKWFNTNNPVAEYNADDSIEFKPEKSVNVVGGISVVFNGTAFEYGSGSRKINLTEDNRLLMYSTPQEINAILENIYNQRASSLIYSSATFSSIGEPALEIGDVISVVDRKGTSYNVLVSSLIFSNNLKMDITSPLLTQEDDNVSSSTESGSIPRESADAIAVHISKNENVSINPSAEADNFLVQRFASESGASPLVFITLVGECSSKGVLSIHLLLDGLNHNFFYDTVNEGKYLKTIACPIVGLVSGNHTLSIRLQSDSSLRISFPKEDSNTSGSIMMLQGSKIGTATSWDGLIVMASAFKRFQARKEQMPVSSFGILAETKYDDQTSATLGEVVPVSIQRTSPTLRAFRETLTTT